MNSNSQRKRLLLKRSASNSNRGLDLEKDLNQSNKVYQELKIALVHKKPTPIKVVQVAGDKHDHRITKAYYTIPSTTDYCGIYKGYYIDYEAKETTSKTRFDFALIHQHQYDHLLDVYYHGGIAFIIVRLKHLHQDVLIPIDLIHTFRMNETRASLPIAWILEYGYLIPYSYRIPVDYIKAIDRMLKKEIL